jgi:hypothetical protein
MSYRLPSGTPEAEGWTSNLRGTMKMCSYLSKTRERAKVAKIFYIFFEHNTATRRAGEEKRLGEVDHCLSPKEH